MTGPAGRRPDLPAPLSTAVDTCLRKAPEARLANVAALGEVVDAVLVTLGLDFRPSREWVLKLNWERSRTDNRPLLEGDAQGFVGSIGFVF